MRYLLLFLIFIAKLAADPVVLSFDGHLSQEKMREIESKLATINDELVLTVQSHSGDLESVLDLSKKIFTSGSKCTVYINDEALGPAAIIPFLAHTLYISPSVTWGSIVSREQSEIPLNILRSRIHGLIPSESPKFPLLKLLSSAMIDSEVQIVNSDGWKAAAETSGKEELITKKGETLVLNQNQIRELQLAEVLTLDAFTARFIKAIPKKEEAAVLVHSSTFTERLKSHIQFPESNPRIGYIALTNRDEAISQSTWITITSALNHFKETRPACLILEINSPGGEVFAAERISDALKEMDTQYGIPVICYINNWAISAGAMLAYSCRYIVIAKDASMGAAEPVMVGAEGKPESASEKVNSALRTDFANRAKYFDRNPYIAEAMVDKDVILVKRHGEIIKLDSEDQIRKGGIDPDTIISPKGKLLTLNAQQLIELGVADMMLIPEKMEPLTDEELQIGLWPLSKTALRQIEFFANVPNLQVEAVQQNWQIRFLALLASPAVSSLLFLVLLLSIYMELSTGGFGVAGAMGLISLFLILLSSFALEAVHWLELILFVFGLFLVLLEIFFFPTLGILGIVGALFLVMAIGGMMLPGIESISFEGDALNAAGEYALERLAWLSAALLLAILIMAALSRYIWPKATFLQRIVLTDDSRSEAARVGTITPTVLTELPEVGAEGVVIATLRPAGKVSIQGHDIDAVSSGSFLEEGTAIRVVSIEGSKVVVEERFS